MPGPGKVNKTPPDGRRHGWPVRPHAVLDGAVEVEQEKRDDIGNARLGYSALSPCLECGCSSVILWRALLRRVWVIGELGNGRDLIVKVLLERLLE